MSLRSRVEQDPSYSYLAAEAICDILYKDILGVDRTARDFASLYRSQFAGQIEKGIAAGLLDPRLRSFDLVRLGEAIEPGRDQLLRYLALESMYDRFLLRDSEQNYLETPQYFWMRIAMGLSLPERETEREEKVIEFYEIMSTLRFLPSTSPTLYHAGTPHPEAGCYVISVRDNVDQIFNAISADAQIANLSAGIGNDWTNVRAGYSGIESVNVATQGVVPFLKVLDSTIAAFNRTGRRHSGAAVYLETWHYDVEDFLNLRKNTGDERRRLYEVNTANWIPDLFMKRVKGDGQWTLFSPDEVPRLHSLYGREFEKEYEECESKADLGEIRLWKRIRARDLWRHMVTMLFETGHPWMTFKDPCNFGSTQDHIGPVCSANLCTEIILNASPEGVAVTTLGSLSLNRHVSNGQVDWEQLIRTIRTGVRMLDNAVEIGQCPSRQTREYALRHRPIGLGFMGFQETLYEIGLDFDSDEAVSFSDYLTEFISYYTILSSSELAKERGAYRTFKGSKWSKGLFPIDALNILEQERGVPTGVPMDSRMKWEVLRDHVRNYGMRNCNCLSIAPTASLSNLAGCYPSIEPVYKNIYVKSNSSGEFTVINEPMVKDLKKRGLWSMEMLNKIKGLDGSIQNIPEIPEELKRKYRGAFEIDPHWVIRHAARRGKWIDQGQSINIFTTSESGNYISDLYFAAWQAGLKTTYYLRTLGASAIEKSTIEISDQ